MLRPALILLLPTLLGAQPWEVQAEGVRAEAPRLEGASLRGFEGSAGGSFQTGDGFVVSLNRRLWIPGPTFRLVGHLEWARWSTRGQISGGGAQVPTCLRQEGPGLGLGAQFWLPFTGLAAEAAVLQRFHRERASAGAASWDPFRSRPWVRGGLRWRTPGPRGLPLTLLFSYQAGRAPSRPPPGPAPADLPAYFAAQGPPGFTRLWSFGLAVPWPK
ncbi:MAG: hypothetical protein HY823_13045 [Acidobacteria bacterium]|nr:hypothetical protein [Acidobacteriota bacterium]